VISDHRKSIRETNTSCNPSNREYGRYLKLGAFVSLSYQLGVESGVEFIQLNQFGLIRLICLSSGCKEFEYNMAMILQMIM
jgi:hypothetical protein